MDNYKECNAENVLVAVNQYIKELEDYKDTYNGNRREFIPIDKVYKKLSIFDWWVNSLSLTQLRNMRDFLEASIELGFKGYVCFKVGAKGCSHGMWSHREESTDGSSPDGDCLYHSFRSGDNYWDGCINGMWLHKKYPDKEEFSLRDIRREVANG